MGQNRKRLLIVEDEISLLKVLDLKFKTERFEVFTATDGEDGLKSALENKPDIILLDIIMPKMDGMTMLRKLRNTDYGKNVPVIILTNLSDSTKVVESMEAGVFDYLVKTNWKLDAVVDRVKRVLKI